MSELQDLRRRMLANAAERREAEAAAGKETASLRDAEEKVRASVRTANPGEAEREVRAARKRLAAARAVRSDLRHDISDALHLLDPTRQIGELSQHIPIALLPLRMETRFMPAGRRSAGPTLLVRLYPDDCLVDTFHPNLSKGERKAVRRFWTEYWAAGGKEPERRAAWAGLVRSHGAGRAAWAVEKVRPSIPANEPVKSDPADVILVTAAPVPPAAEKAAIEQYWEKVLRSGRNAAAQASAFGALEGALGQARAAEVKETLEPGNIRVKKPPAAATVSFAYLEFDEDADEPFWSRAARTEMLPDRLVLLGAPRGRPLRQLAIGPLIPAPLSVSPDPEALKEDWLDAAGNRLLAPEEIAWMFDFEKALPIGMAFEVDLAAHGAEGGFDELIALGLRLDPDPAAGAAELEELFRRHRYGSAGLAIVPQGTPTNNSDGQPSGRGDPDDPDTSYDHVLGALQNYATPGSAHGPNDGIALSRGLGLTSTTFEGIVGAEGFDIAEAKAMNVALWPATFGHFFNEMMAPVVTDDVIGRTRRFFTDHVSGRGMLPALRINRQPYGILPTTAFSVFSFEGRGADIGYRRDIHRVLETMAEDWRHIARNVKTVMSRGDPQQNLLDVLGLHPASVEHYVRLAESWNHLFNQARLLGFGAMLRTALMQAAQRKGVSDLLRRLGYNGTARPTIIERVFLADPPEQPRTPVIEEAPLSEDRALQAATTDNLNYIAWLAANALASPDAIRAESGFVEGKTPTALLYLYLRDALLTGFAEESDLRRVRAGVLEAGIAAEMKRSHAFIHVGREEPFAKSRYASMYSREPQVTGTDDLLIGDFISKALAGGDRDMPPGQIVTALEALKDLPTARLERLFCEHLDCSSYRLDAWRLGLVRQRLEELRNGASNDDEEEDGNDVPGGIYLGAYAYLANVRPKASRRSVHDIPDELKGTFGSRPVEVDSLNRGYMLAPGINHSITAAVLRSARDGNRGELEINLSSERVRRALFLQDGLRQGQSLGALLGYMFERGVHDAPGTGVAEGYLQELRAQFPLVANHMKETAEPVAGEAIETIEARNVVDGVRFIEHCAKAGASYPYSLPLTATDTGVHQIFDTNLQAIIEAQDALADLSIAESVHQALMSNIDRASGTLSTFAEGKLPGETPAVVRSQRSGRTITFRLALHLNGAVAPSPAAPVRATLDAALNSFISAQLPSLDRIGASVFVKERNSATEAKYRVTADDLGLSAIDLIRLIGAPTPDPLLDTLIISHVRRDQSLSPFAEVWIAYLEPAGDFRFIEIAPQAGHWRKLLFASRPLAASDLTLPRDGEGQGRAARINPARISLAQAKVEGLRDKLLAEAAGLKTLLDGLPATQNALVAAIDDMLERCEPLALEAALLGCSGAEVEWMWSFKAKEWRTSLEAVDETRSRWQAKRTAANEALQNFDSPPPGATPESLFKLLQDAESAISAELSLEPGPAAGYRAALETRRTEFGQRLQDLNDLSSPSSFGMAELVSALEAAPFLSTFDSGELPSSADVRSAIERAAADLLAQCTRLAKELDSRVTAAVAAIAGIAPADLSMSVDQLQTAGRALAGEEARIVPEFSLTPDAAAELEFSLTAGDGPLLAHAKSRSLDPLDDWLHGLARVRPKIRFLEQAILLGEAIAGSPTIRLSPAQLPHLPDDHWLGDALPPGHVIEQETLLYTAIFASPFIAGAPVSGLLLDEWTELIPSEEETVGLAYHFDAPNSEPPQSWLLAVSPQLGKGWQWDDLVDCVRETVDMAKLRAVDPTLLDDEAYSQILPATVLTVTRWPITISTMLNRLDLTVLSDA